LGKQKTKFQLSKLTFKGRGPEGRGGDRRQSKARHGNPGLTYPVAFDSAQDVQLQPVSRAGRKWCYWGYTTDTHRLHG